MAGMRLCTGHLFPIEIEAEIFSAVMAEFKEVLIQNRATNLTVTNLHFSPKTKDPRVRGFTGSSNVGIPAYRPRSRPRARQARTADEILFNSPPVNGDGTDFLDPLHPGTLEPFLSHQGANFVT